MSRYRCDDCGVVLTSPADISGHRQRTHPSPSDLTDMLDELTDQWVMINACAHDQEWLYLSLALDNHLKLLKRWKTATERMLLR